jgi:hypothetical protein
MLIAIGEIRMEDSSYNSAKYALYTIAHALGTKEISQVSLIKALHSIEAEHLNHRETLLRMISIFYDGLAYGNWPKS